MIEDDKPAVFSDVLGSQDHLFRLRIGPFTRESNVRIAQQTKVLFQGQTTQLGERAQGLGRCPGSRIEDDVFHPGPLDLFHQIGQESQTFRLIDSQGSFVLLGQLSHGLPVVLVRSVNEGLAAVGLGQSGLHGGRVLGHQDQRQLGLGPHRLYAGRVGIRIAGGVFHGNAVEP